MIKKLNTSAKILTNITALVFGLTLVGSEMAMENSGNITSMLHQASQIAVTNPDSDVDTLYHMTDYETIAEVKENAGSVEEKITEEGSVLLKNTNKALPLTENCKINLYSSSSVNYIYSGGGSSLAKNAEYVTLKEGLENSGFTVNQGLWDFYTNNPAYFGGHLSTTSSDGAPYNISDASWDQIDASKNDEAELGIFVLSRYGTEATDNAYTGGGKKNDYSHGNYLELSPTEISVLEGMKELKKNGKLKKIMILLNSVNQVQVDYDDDAIDAILWVGEGGSTGTNGIGKILSGAVNPSGKLSDTFFKKHFYNPVYANFGDYVNEGLVIGDSATGKSNKYVVYQEGIYNGYRYTETRYEDKVLSTANVGDFVYDDVVAYPFGYGLSYSSYEYQNMKVTEDQADGCYYVSVDVKNTGTVAGKEAVQVFVQRPYTDYDRENHIEKAAVDFIGYGKTKLLAPNESETVKVKVDERFLAAYDAYRAKTFIMDEGDYYLSVASDAHQAVNNILAAKKNDGTSINEAQLVGAAGNQNLVYKVHKDFDNETYSKSKVTGNEITNQFDNADLNLYEHAGDNHVDYISRSDWNGTVKLGITATNEKLANHVVITTNQGMLDDSRKLSDTIQMDDIAYPTYGAENDMTLASMLNIVDGQLEPTAYDDERWDALLDELSFNDTVMLLSNGLRKTKGISSIGKPETIDGNGGIGPVGGVTYSYANNENVAENRFAFLAEDDDMDTSPIMYPCAMLISNTRNDDLAKDIGESIGEDCLWMGYSGLYGIGANIHRGTYSGRAFEYYGEDGVLSGYISASEVRGIRSKGIYVYMKHAILNDQEKNREGVNTWANEQTIRENYLRSFEISIEEGGAENIMSGFNRIGVVWTGQHGFINSVLRDEYGMTGFAVSDYWQSKYMDLVGGIMNGNALPDGDTATSADKSSLWKYKEGYGAVANAMREEAHRILYVVVNSAAMNGFDASTMFITVTPPWISALNAVKVSVICVFSASVLFYAVTIVLYEITTRRKPM